MALPDLEGEFLFPAEVSLFEPDGIAVRIFKTLQTGVKVFEVVDGALSDRGDLGAAVDAFSTAEDRYQQVTVPAV